MHPPAALISQCTPTNHRLHRQHTRSARGNTSAVVRCDGWPPGPAPEQSLLDLCPVAQGAEPAMARIAVARKWSTPINWVRRVSGQTEKAATARESRFDSGPGIV